MSFLHSHWRNSRNDNDLDDKLHPRVSCSLRSSSLHRDDWDWCQRNDVIEMDALPLPRDLRGASRVRWGRRPRTAVSLPLGRPLIRRQSPSSSPSSASSPFSSSPFFPPSSSSPPLPSFSSYSSYSPSSSRSLPGLWGLISSVVAFSLVRLIYRTFVPLLFAIILLFLPSFIRFFFSTLLLLRRLWCFMEIGWFIVRYSLFHCSSSPSPSPPLFFSLFHTLLSILIFHFVYQFSFSSSLVFLSSIQPSVLQVTTPRDRDT